MLRDLLAGRDGQAEAALDVIAHVDADVILLGDVDWDAGGAGLDALRARLAGHGLDYAHAVALRPNAGVPSGRDVDGDGRLGEAEDALGWGRFTGESGIALLSRFPLGPVEDHTPTPWDAPDGLLPAGVSLPVATVAQWVVPVAGLSLVTLAAGPPVFDGPEDRNGHRNAAELALARDLAAAADVPVVLGRANVDPVDGEGRRDALRALLDAPFLHDPEPRGRGGGGEGHGGDPALDTAAWWDGPGPLRVDYVLPAAPLAVMGSGVVWPAEDDPFRATAEAAGPGRAVWVDLDVPLP